MRGVLGSTVVLSCNIGMLIAFTLGNFCNFYTTPIFVIGLTIVYALCIAFLPETPSFLMKQNKIEVNLLQPGIFCLLARISALNFIDLLIFICRRWRDRFDFIKISRARQMTLNYFK